MAFGLAACTEANIASQDAHNGPGVVQPGTPVPDVNVPGGLRGELTVDNMSIAPLRAALSNLFESGADGGHAVMTLAPQPGFAGMPACASGGQPCCTFGDRNLCLQAVRVGGPGVPAVSLFNNIDIQFDPNRVSLGPGDTVRWGPALTTGIDLTSPSPFNDQWFLLRRILIGDNRELLVRFHPDQLKVEARGGQTGLWIPVTLTPVGDTQARNECYLTSKPVKVQPADGTFGPALCNEFITRMNDSLDERVPSGFLNFLGLSPSDVHCNGFIVHTQFSVLRFFIGLIPERKADCSFPNAFRPDLKWMQNVPGAERYPNGCLSVRAVVEPGITVSPPGGAGALTVAAQRGSYCSSAVESFCSHAPAAVLARELWGVDDCTTEANRTAAINIQRQINSRIRTIMEQQVLPYFTYNGSAFNQASAGPGCDPRTSACGNFIRNHGLPASLTALAYGMFAKAFGSYSTAPKYQYPVTEVEPALCPSGYTRYAGADASQPDICVQCDQLNPFCKFSESLRTCCVGSCFPPSGSFCDTSVTPAGTRINFSFAADPDADGIAEDVDNCPGVYNPTQSDTGDGDGIGDACDKCACDPDPEDADIDGDGVCNTECNGAPGDNCPTVANPFQENCNADAERARQAEVLGDVCDPVPCPKFKPVFQSFSEAGNQFGLDRIVTTSLNRLDFDPIGSFDRNASQATEQEVTVSATHYRHCLEAPLVTGTSCFADAAVDDLRLDPGGSRITENELTLWHRVQLAGKAVGAPDFNRRYGTNNTYSRTWDYFADYAWWRGTGWGASWVPNLAAPSPLSFIARGRFWTHGATDVGTSDASLGTGVHFRQGLPGVAADGLANHYQDVSPLSQSRQLVGVRGAIFPWIIRDCPHCRQSLGLPQRDCAICTLEAFSEFPSLVSRVLTVQPDGQVGVLTTVGTLSPLETPLSSNLTASLGAGLSWLSQAEPSAYLGQSAIRPLAVGLSADATLAEQVYSADGQLLSQSDLMGMGGQVASAAQSTPSTRMQRFDYVGVYSRSTGRVFLLGGRDASGNAIQRIWMRHLSEDSWQALPRGSHSLGKVLTATYSHADGLLWILDEQPGPHFLVQRRLLTYDPETGETTLLFERRGLPHWTDHELVTDRDGSVLLSLSGHKAPAYRLVRFRNVGGELTTERSTPSLGRLEAPVVVDDAGYWIIRRPPGKKKLLAPQRLDTLPLEPVATRQCLPGGL